MLIKRLKMILKKKKNSPKEAAETARKSSVKVEEADGIIMILDKKGRPQ